MLPVIGAEFTCKQPVTFPSSTSDDGRCSKQPDRHAQMSETLPFNQNLKLHVTWLTYMNHQFTDLISRSDFPLCLVQSGLFRAVVNHLHISYWPSAVLLAAKKMEPSLESDRVPEV